MTSDPGASSVLGSQVMTTDMLAGQPAVESPSETVAVSVTGPGAVQTKVGVAEVAPPKEPEAAVQLYESGAGPLSGSCAAMASATGKPTATSAGLAESASTTGQTLRVPLTATLPVVAGWWQSSVTLTLATAPAVTLKVALPAQVVAPSVPVALSVIVKPLPAGRPPMIAEIVLLDATSIAPEVAKPFGPVIV